MYDTISCYQLINYITKQRFSAPNHTTKTNITCCGVIAGIINLSYNPPGDSFTQYLPTNLF